MMMRPSMAWANSRRMPSRTHQEDDVDLAQRWRSTSRSVSSLSAVSSSSSSRASSRWDWDYRCVNRSPVTHANHPPTPMTTLAPLRLRPNVLSSVLLPPPRVSLNNPRQKLAFVLNHDPDLLDGACKTIVTPTRESDLPSKRPTQDRQMDVLPPLRALPGSTHKQHAARSASPLSPSVVPPPLDWLQDESMEEAKNQEAPCSNRTPQQQQQQEAASASSSKKPKKKRIRKPRYCKHEGCTKYVVDRGLCIRHGGGKRCYIEDCGCRAQNHGLCWKHGGYTMCTFEGCKKRAKSRGMCWAHGGGTKCKLEGCNTIAVSRGRCWAHGGGKRCLVVGCEKPAYRKQDDLCAQHFHEQQVTDDDGSSHSP